jgi:hypothetical protein
MFIWSLVLFGLGILAILDSQFNYGYLFRTANAIMFMLVSLGMLIRTRIMRNLGYKERLVEYNRELKARVRELKQVTEPEETGKAKQAATA